jgi:hypothetical protein
VVEPEIQRRHPTHGQRAAFRLEAGAERDPDRHAAGLIEQGEDNPAGQPALRRVAD